MTTASAALFFFTRLTSLTSIDIVILAIYFAMVIFVGFDLNGPTNTVGEFFLAGRKASGVFIEGGLRSDL